MPPPEGVTIFCSVTKRLEATASWFGSDVDANILRAARENAEAAGVASAIDFRIAAVETLALAAEIAPRGLTLTASNTIDDWTVFKIKNNQTHQTCAVVECLPETGDLRPVGAAGRQ